MRNTNPAKPNSLHGHTAPHVFRCLKNALGAAGHTANYKWCAPSKRVWSTLYPTTQPTLQFRRTHLCVNGRVYRYLIRCLHSYDPATVQLQSEKVVHKQIGQLPFFKPD
ncbi:hypothetical protein TRVL_07311 [Trypanosoma vivax]|nr:hypothetical protein TRVL_07311 [Trypanosoma vivax]